MNVPVRLSAGLAQVAGQARLQVTVADDATVADLVAQLLREYPALQPRLRHAVPILAGSHASQQDVLAAGQEVAFLMPVAGGGNLCP